jgi:hypothetical protein
MRGLEGAVLTLALLACGAGSSGGGGGKGARTNNSIEATRKGIDRIAAA